MRVVAFIKNVLLNARRTLPTSLFFTALLSLTVNPLSDGKIGFKSFDRVFGQATLVGIDASKRISNFTVFNVLLLPLFLIISVLICHCFTVNAEHKSPKEKAFKFLNTISTCGLALALVFVFNKYSILGRSLYFKNYGVQISLVLIFITLVYIRRPFLDFEKFRFALYVGFGMALFINFLFQGPESQISPKPFRFGLVFLASIVAILVFLKATKLDDLNRLKISFVPLSFGMLFSGLTLEFCNILNQHGVFIENRILVAKLTYGLFLGASVVLFAIGNKRFMEKSKLFAKLEIISLIGLLLSLYYFTVIPPLQITPGTEVFEQANHGMLANDFLAWGKIPIVNSFDGHMLSNSLGMIVYGLLNGDVSGASYLGYGFVWMLPMVICLFLVYKNVFDKDFAFFFMIIVPAVSTLSVQPSIISVIALIYALKKRTFGAYFWLLFSVVIATLDQAPNGASYGGGVLIITVIILVVEAIKARKLTDDMKNFGKSFGVFAGVMVALWSGLCIIQGINPVKRFKEFLSIAQSTNTWTYSNIGDMATATFSLLYSVLPIIAVGCLVWLVVKFKYTPSHITSAALLLAYILNFTRMLGRHSLVENQMTVVIWTAILGIALFATTVVPKWKHVMFIATGVFVITAVFNVGAIQNATSVANTAITTANSPQTYYNGSSEKTTRVNLKAPLEKYENVINMIDSVVPQDETYFDLTSQTLLYALSGREKPVYINQSPLHLSGEYSQERFVEQVKNFKGICDFALLFDGAFSVGFSGGLDSLSQPYRYYKVYEYLYENYRPLCKSSDNFYLWVKKDRYDTFSSRMEEHATIPLDKSSVALNDLTFISKSPLVLQSGNQTPHITFSLPEPINIDPGRGATYEVRIAYKASAPGEYQMFYDFSGFNERDSSPKVFAETSEHDEAAFYIPWQNTPASLNAIRLFLPENVTIDIESISIVAIALNSTTKCTELKKPVSRSEFTDKYWTSGISNNNRNQFLIDAALANELTYASTLYSANDSAKIISIQADSSYVIVTTDKDASIFDNGIVGSDLLYSRAKPTDYNSFGTIHTTSLGQLPYVWGQFDNKKSWNNPLIREFSDVSGFLPDEVQENAKYTVLTIDSETDGNASLAFQNSDGKSISVFKFSILKGSNRYIVRSSIDWWWNSGNISSFAVKTDVNANLLNVKFLAGD